MSESNNKTLNAVFEAALQLSADERELLMTMLAQHDAPGWVSPEIERAWMEEIERREQLHREGKNPNMSAEEVFAKLAARLDSMQK